MDPVLFSKTTSRFMVSHAFRKTKVNLMLEEKEKYDIPDVLACLRFLSSALLWRVPLVVSLL